MYYRAESIFVPVKKECRETNASRSTQYSPNLHENESASSPFRLATNVKVFISSTSFNPHFQKKRDTEKNKRKWFNISLALNVKCLPPTVVQSAAECTIVPENIKKLTGQITRHCVDLLLRFVTHIAKSTQLNLNRISWFR
jgi:hypothetical protein